MIKRHSVESDPLGPDSIPRGRVGAHRERLQCRRSRRDRDPVRRRQRLPRAPRQRRGGARAHSHGTFVNGFHETWPIRHAEEAFGFARVGQTIVNAPDNKVMKLYVDDEPLLLSVADLEHYQRTLDFRDGVLRRSLIWRTPAGQAGPGRLDPDGVLHPAASGDHDHRGHHAGRGGAGGDLVADPESPGRQGRVSRPRRGDGRGRRSAPGRGVRRAGAASRRRTGAATGGSSSATAAPTPR